MENKTVPAKLKLTLAVGECNGYMNSQWFVNDQLIHDIKPINDKSIDLEFMLELPCTVSAVISNKNMDRDTLIDSDGNILKDKFLQIADANLCGWEIPPVALLNICQFETADKRSNEIYFGAPGKVTIEFVENDPIRWHLKHNHFHY